jgi:hypothetical protein
VDRARPAEILTNRLLIMLAAVLLAGAGASRLSRLHPARWLAPDADAIQALSTSLTECLRAPGDPGQAYLVEVGRTAFRTPMLLGGQAARAGIACESCHQAGRRNADFFFPRLSGAPGTADVTSALFSSHRDDGIDNPKPIPDLSGPKSALKISQDPANGALEGFIHGLITQEFDGAEPPPAVLKGLAAYVRNLSPAACPASVREPVRVLSQVDEARRSVGAARLALQHKDPDTAVLMIEGARWRLGLIDERFDAPQSNEARAALEPASLDLAAAIAAVRAGDPRASERLSLWLTRSIGWAPVLQQGEPQSLYDKQRLAEAIAGG